MGDTMRERQARFGRPVGLDYLLKGLAGEDPVPLAKWSPRELAWAAHETKGKVKEAFAAELARRGVSLRYNEDENLEAVKNGGVLATYLTKETA